MLRINKIELTQGSFNLDVKDVIVGEGKLILLIGPNGSGKTTFLKTLAGLVKNSGDIMFDEIRTSALGFKERAKLFGYLPQRVSLSEMLVKDFILMGRFPYTRILSGYAANDLNVVEKVSHDFGVYEYLERDISGLSQGEFQRVLLAKVFAQSPKILLLDEPTTSLDMGHKHSVRRQIMDYRKINTNSIIFISTHEPELFEDISDGFVMLKNGKIFKQGDIKSYDKSDFKELFDLR